MPIIKASLKTKGASMIQSVIGLAVLCAGFAFAIICKRLAETERSKHLKFRRG